MEENLKIFAMRLQGLVFLSKLKTVAASDPLHVRITIMPNVLEGHDRLE